MSHRFTDEGVMWGGMYTKTSILYPNHTLQDMFNYKLNLYSRGYYLRFLRYSNILYQTYLEQRVPFHIAKLIVSFLELEAYRCVPPPIYRTILIPHHLHHLFTFNHQLDSSTVIIKSTFHLLTTSTLLVNIVKKYVGAYQPCRLQTSYLRFCSNSRKIQLANVTSINNPIIDGPVYECGATNVAVAKCTRQITLAFIGLYNYFNTIHLDQTVPFPS